MREAHQSQRRIGAALQFLATHPMAAQAERHIVEHR
jgi:hypothetical protein